MQQYKRKKNRESRQNPTVTQQHRPVRSCCAFPGQRYGRLSDTSLDICVVMLCSVQLRVAMQCRARWDVGPSEMRRRREVGGSAATWLTGMGKQKKMVLGLERHWKGRCLETAGERFGTFDSGGLNVVFCFSCVFCVFLCLLYYPFFFLDILPFSFSPNHSRFFPITSPHHAAYTSRHRHLHPQCCLPLTLAHEARGWQLLRQKRAGDGHSRWRMADGRWRGRQLVSYLRVQRCHAGCEGCEWCRSRGQGKGQGKA